MVCVGGDTRVGLLESGSFKGRSTHQHGVPVKEVGGVRGVVREGLRVVHDLLFIKERGIVTREKIEKNDLIASFFYQCDFLNHVM